MFCDSLTGFSERSDVLSDALYFSTVVAVMWEETDALGDSLNSCDAPSSKRLLRLSS